MNPQRAAQLRRSSWVAPIMGAAVAGAVYTVFETKPEPMVREALSGR